jgi:hypothetical protein
VSEAQDRELWIEVVSVSNLLSPCTCPGRALQMEPLKRCPMWPLPVFWPIFSSFAPFPFPGNCTPPHRKHSTLLPHPWTLQIWMSLALARCWLSCPISIIAIFGWSGGRLLFLKLSLEISVSPPFQFKLKPSSLFQGNQYGRDYLRSSLFLLLVLFDSTCGKAMTRTTGRGSRIPPWWLSVPLSLAKFNYIFIVSKCFL